VRISTFRANTRALARGALLAEPLVESLSRLPESG